MDEDYEAPDGLPMTAPTPTSDAVQIVAKALTIALATSDTPYEDVVAALAAADLLARPGELAALRAVAEAAQTFRYRFVNELSGASTAMELLFATLDAAPRPAPRAGQIRTTPT